MGDAAGELGNAKDDVGSAFGFQVGTVSRLDGSIASDGPSPPFLPFAMVVFFRKGTGVRRVVWVSLLGVGSAGFQATGTCPAPVPSPRVLRHSLGK